jgi:hypothetical protein
MKISSIAREFEHQISIEILSLTQDDYIISLVDEEGRILKMFGINLSVGVNRFWVEQLEFLSSGSYYLHIINTHGKSLYCTELIKQ